MAEPTHGYTGPSDDSPCYNCGGRGHWMVACPEPTRKTPAGLANAWRNSSSNALQGSSRQHHGNSKRSTKGLIITKYAPGPPPPPPPPPPSSSSLGHGTPSYPPLAGPSYPQPSPQFQSSYPHYPPAPHYSAGYGPPAYLSPHYPPPPYGTAPAAPVGYATQPPGPPAPAPAPAPYPPAYGSYPPAGSSTAAGYPPQATYAPPYPQASYGPPPVPFPPHGGPTQYPPPAAAPPKPSRPSHSHSSLKEPVHHSLPPKPPKSVHTQQGPHRDHRNKRKHDRHGKHRDHKRGDQGSRHRSSHQKTHHKANRAGSAIRSSQKAEVPVDAEGTKDAKLLPTPGLQERDAGFGPEASKTGSRKALAAAEKLAWDNGQDPQQNHDQPNSRGPGEESQAVSEPVKTRISDNKPERLDQRPLANGEAVPTYDNEWLPQKPQCDGKDGASTLVSFHSDMSRPNGKHKRPYDESGDERQPKRRKSSGSFTGGLNDARGDNRKEAQHDARQEAQGDDDPPEQEEDDQALPQLERRSRSRSKERYRKPNEPRSRNSSVSSRSSDLNSLEAELLGRPAKRSPPDMGLHQRQDRLALPKIQRRRQPNADSAYSRRW